MLPRIIDTKYVDGFTIRLKFSDGTVGELDLEHELDGEISKELRVVN